MHSDRESEAARVREAAKHERKLARRAARRAFKAASREAMGLPTRAEAKTAANAPAEAATPSKQLSLF